MEHDEIKFVLIELYEKNQIRLSGNKKYEFKLTDKRNEMLDKFIVNIQTKVSAVDITLLKGYMVYAFGTYAGRGVAENPTAFYSSWIISFALFQKFLKHKAGRKYAIQKNFQKERRNLIMFGRDVGDKVGKPRKRVKGVLEEIETSYEREERVARQRKLMDEIDPLEEKEKKRFYGKIKGRLWCVDFTTLYNERSEICRECKFKDGCIETLKDHLPNLYKLRNG